MSSLRTSNNREDKIRDESPNTVTIWSTWTSMKLLREWEDDCKANYGDCRWLKMWNDHLSSKYLSVLRGEIDELRARIDRLENRPKEPEPEIKTLGKGE